MMLAMKARRMLLGLLVLLAVAIYALFFVTPSGARSLREFNPDRTAALEVDMWKAYYKGENVRLFRGLVTLTHEQFRYSWARALQASFHLGRAAARFAKMRSDYDTVLPDLEAGYTIARDWTEDTFDPKAVAKAELAWWVARRIPGQNSPENVGGLIADENALLYHVPRERVLEASILRARAGRLRDDGGENADWAEVSRLLIESFRALHAAIHSP
jgi:hypothetical protein